MLTNWLTSELTGQINKASIGINEYKITPSNFAKLVKLIENDTISGKIAKTVFDIIFETRKAHDKIIEENGLVQVSDNNVLNTIIDEVIAENPESVKGYRSGKYKLFSFFVGQVKKKPAVRLIRRL